MERWEGDREKIHSLDVQRVPLTLWPTTNELGEGHWKDTGLTIPGAH